MTISSLFHGHQSRLGGVALLLMAAACSSVDNTPSSGQPEPTASQAPSTNSAGFEVLESAVTRTVPNVDAETRATLSSDNWQFALDLYAQLAQEPGNLFYSPYSISTAMAMAYVGARANTKAELAAALRYTLEDAALHPAFNALDRTLTSRAVEATEQRGGLELATRNDIWAHIVEARRPLQSYVDDLAENYSAPVKLVDFDNEPAAREAINAEVKRQTNGTVQELIPEGVIIPFHTLMVLTNTIYLKAAWQTPFDQGMTVEAPFTNADGTETQAQLMHSMTSVEYTTGDGFQAVRLPYVGGDVAMTVILPESGKFDVVEQSLALVNTAELEFETTPVDLRLPKFQMRSNVGLKTALMALGVHDAFLQGAADFTAIRTASPYIQEVLHEAFIAVDEVGTEAGAATAVVFGDESAPLEPEIEFTADRPFIVTIEDVPSATLLFAGRVTQL
jgi:serpin B